MRQLILFMVFMYLIFSAIVGGGIAAGAAKAGSCSSDMFSLTEVLNKRETLTSKISFVPLIPAYYFTMLGLVMNENKDNCKGK